MPSHVELDLGWRVVLETRDRSGVPYPNIYAHVLADSREAAIDHVLENYVGASAGERYLVDGWMVVAAWAVREDLVGDTIAIEPIRQALFQRRVDAAA